MTDHPLQADNYRRTLDARARLLAVPPIKETDTGETVHLLAVLLGGERYGVDIDMVRETLPMDRRNWTRVPCSPNFVIGAVNIRGRIYSIMDISRFFGLPSQPWPENPHAVLVSNENGAAGEMELCLLADSLPELVHFTQCQIKSAAAIVSSQANEFILGITEDMLIILDLDRLLSDPRIIVHEEV